MVRSCRRVAGRRPWAWRVWCAVPAVLACAGCVSVRTYDALKYQLEQEGIARREAEDTLRRVRQQMRSSEGTLAVDRERLIAIEDENAQLRQTVARLENDAQGEEALQLVRRRTLLIAAAAELREQFRLALNEETGGLMLEHDVLFKGQETRLAPDAVQLLGLIARALNAPAYAGMLVYVDGHTDGRPISHNFEVNPTNWVLGARRADAVRACIEKAGVTPSRLVLRSFGYARPRVRENPNAPQNRRVEIVLGDAARR